MDRLKSLFGRVKALMGSIKDSINTQKIKELIETIKNNKVLALKIGAGTAVALICIVSLIITASNSYKPDSETLKIVNEAAVIVYDSEISEEYKNYGSQKINGHKFRVMEFALKNKSVATFAFDRNIKDTREIYWKNGDEFVRVIFVNPDDGQRDNTADWLADWQL